MFLLPWNQQFFPLFVVVLVLWILTSIIWRIFWFILFINEQTGRWTVSRRPRSVVGTRRWCWPSLTSTRGVPTQARTWWTRSPTNTVNTTMTGTESITTSKSRRTRQSKSFISILKKYCKEWRVFMLLLKDEGQKTKTTLKIYRYIYISIFWEPFLFPLCIFVLIEFHCFAPGVQSVGMLFGCWNIPLMSAYLENPFFLKTILGILVPSKE